PRVARRVGPRIRSLRARAHARVVRWSLADHPAVLLRASRLCPASPPRLDLVARTRARERREAPDRDRRALRGRAWWRGGRGRARKRAPARSGARGPRRGRITQALSALRVGGRLAGRVRAAG